MYIIFDILEVLFDLIGVGIDVKLHNEEKKGNVKKSKMMRLAIIVFCIVLIFVSLLVFGIIKYL